jgi:hypothetical protein
MRTQYELKKEIAEVQATKQTATISLTADNGKAEDQVMLIPDAWLLSHRTTSKKSSCILCL